MITDENGVKHPETVEDQVQLRKEEEQAQRREEFWNRKAKREGWARPELNQGAKPEKEETRLDRMFKKRHPEWYRKEQPEEQKPKKRPWYKDWGM